MYYFIYFIKVIAVKKNIKDLGKNMLSAGFLFSTISHKI